MPSAKSTDEMWRDFLAGEIEGLEGLKRMFRRFPSAPRCKICQAPFGGLGGKVLRFTPFRRWDANATICNICTDGASGIGGSDDQPASLPVGIGIHTGLAYVGVPGTDGGQLDFTGVGDAVNTAARLGSVAGAGELLVSIATARRGNLGTDGLERRTLELKGREEPVDVVVLARSAVGA